MVVADEYGEEYDEFRPGTGLKDDYDGLVNDGYFGTPQTGGERLMAFLKVSADDGDEVELRYSVGNGWTSYDGGKTVERSDGGERYFNNRTAWQQFISRCWTLEGCKEEMGRRSHELLDRRGPRDSRLLIGMRFHFNVETETMNLPERDEMGIPKRDERGQQITQAVEVSRVMPTAYLGTKDDAAPKPPKSRGGSKSTTTTATAEAPSSTSPTNGADPTLMAKMKVYAKTKPYDEWVDAVMGIEGVLDDGELVGKLSDESFYESLKS